jgi:hypothetical protein
VVSAQTVATSLDDLTGIAMAGSTVKVTDARGQEVEGKLTERATSGRSFADLQSILKTGDEVQITDSSGQTTRGRIAGVSTNSLGLTVDGRQRDLPEATVREVKRRRPDLWWNGTLIGAVIGTVVGAVVKERNCGSTDCGEGGVVDPGFYMFGAGIGAGAGALVDLSIRRFDTLFVSPSPASVRRFRLSPVLSRNTQGVHVSVTF